MLPKILLGVGIFAAVFSILIFSGKVPIGNKKETPKGEVVIWGTFPEEGMIPLIQEFNPKVKTYRVSYKKIREENFSQTLVNAIANGSGPDMILAPYQIILEQSSRIYPFPVNEKDYKDNYVDGANVFLSPYGTLALPISVEPMVLFYNRALFSKHGVINPPATWHDVIEDVPLLTVKDSRGQFLESAIALGSHNTPYAKDILMSMVYQYGQVPILKKYDDSGKMYVSVTANLSTKPDDGGVFPLASSVGFFTLFADPTQNVYTWNQYLGNADELFVAEKLAMYIGYSGELGSLRERNPRGDFEMSALPQIKGQNTFATGMRMYGLSTLRTTRNLSASLEVEAQFSGGGVSPSLSAIVGGVSALRGYASTQGLHPTIAKSMLVTKGWYDIYYDQSSANISIMIADVLSGRVGVNDAVNTFVARLQDLYSPY